MRALFFLFLLINFYITSEEFSFKSIKGQKFKIECAIDGQQYLNGKLVASYNQKYKTIRTIKNVDGTKAEIEDDYYYYNINKFLANNEMLQITDNNIVTYYRESNGIMTVQDDQKIPSIRSAPFFPNRTIIPGDKWSSPATEVQDVYNDNTLSFFPIDVSYEFIGYEETDDKKIAKILYQYHLRAQNNFTNKIDNRILYIDGISKTLMFFDFDNGTRIKELYERQYFIKTKNGEYVLNFEITDSGERIWTPIELMKKEELVDDIKKDFEENNIKDATIEKDDIGLKITLQNIRFAPESSTLEPSEIERLDSISNILEKYKGKGILVVGHTTDRGTEKGRKILSQERAKSVAEYLIIREAVDKSKLSYYGKGGEEPIADNNTEEGLNLNRRVEIFILEE
ncbi:MAG: OmpA family protein [Spirochaetes bacterium]|nr:OmpA family protein [Spirochaetota bacterium]